MPLAIHSCLIPMPTHHQPPHPTVFDPVPTFPISCPSLQPMLTFCLSSLPSLPLPLKFQLHNPPSYKQLIIFSIFLSSLWSLLWFWWWFSLLTGHPLQPPHHWHPIGPGIPPCVKSLLYIIKYFSWSLVWPLSSHLSILSTHCSPLVFLCHTPSSSSSSGIGNTNYSDCLTIYLRT